MDKQKVIPPLSQKITRKLASESADHNHVMNFYSSISRDESGAPKKWKMSNPIQITEQMTAMSSSTSIRDSSSERKNKAVNKPISNLKKRSSSKDSPDRNSSRDSSQESKDRNSKENKGRRSLSAEGTSKVDNPVENGLKADGETVKRKRRPKSLDLSSKSLTNGDDDNFRSPHPLTPCNIAVKRRKGRPKETPPTLVAESPVESLNDSVVNDSVVTSDTEIDKKQEQQQTEPVPKRKGRKANTSKVVTAKNLGKQFGKKKFESGVKTIGSKIIKKRLFKGFKKLPPSATLRKDTKLASDSVNKSTEKDKKDNDLISPKRKPGRPPGARNKPKSPSPELVSPSLSPEKRKGGRPPGSKNKTLIGVIPKKKRQKPENLKSEMRTDSAESPLTNNKVKAAAVSDDSDTVLKNTDMPSQTAIPKEEPMETSDSSISVSSTSKIEDSINSVILNAVETKEIDMPVKKPTALRTANFKEKKGVKSLGKLKKENINAQRVKKKRVLISHATNLDFMSSLAHLPSNDLRRKLQKKLLEKLNGKRPKSGISTISSEVKEQNEMDVKVDTNNEDFEASVTPNEDVKNMDDKEDDTVNEDISEATGARKSVEKDIHEDIQSLSALVEKKRVTKTETEAAKNEIEVVAFEQKKKSIRPRKSNSEQRELSKFSDSESVCSELSTQSLGSLRRSREKQILILGEENTDSDDNTVRTRQRFEIIPGKKRKRTLSGEFDLVDERQLRKQQKQTEQGEELSADESDVIPDDDTKSVTKKKSPVKVSPKMKLKKDLLGKKLNKTNPNVSVYRAKLLKQSPFLGKVRKRRKIWYRNRFLSSSASDSELGAYGVDTSELVKVETKEIELKEETDIVPVKTEMMEPEYPTETDSKISELASEKTNDEQQMDSKILELVSEKSNDDQEDSNISELVTEKSNNDQADSKITELVSEKSNDDQADSKISELVSEKSNDDQADSKISELVTEKSNDDQADSKISELVSEKSNDDQADGKISELVSEKSNNDQELADSPLSKVDKVDELCSQDNEVLESKCDETTVADSQVVESLECLENETNETNKNETEKINCESLAKEIVMELIDSVVTKKVGNDVLQSDENSTLSMSDKMMSPTEEQKDMPNSETAAIIQSTEHTLNESKVLNSEGITKTPLSGRGGRSRGRRGRRPYKHLLLSRGGATATAGVEKKIREKKSNKDSPEFGGVTRKFELRQKISRSPLDNIALKQSIEENEYYKNEAQKAVRKEMKKAKKSPLSVENVATLADEAEIESVELPVVTDDPESEGALEETESRTQLLLNECKSCSVVLTDFIKQLGLAGGRVTSEDETENDTEESISDNDHATDTSPQHCPNEMEIDPESENIESDTLKTETADIAIPQPGIAANDRDKATNDNVANVPNTESPKYKVEEIYPKDNQNELSSAENKNELNSVKQSVPNSESKTEVVENQTKAKVTGSRPISSKSKSNTVAVNASLSVPSLPIAAPVTKSKRTSRKSIQSGAGRGRRPAAQTVIIPEVPEPQTARKTVPPLKIRVKEAPRSRRKTYMVETIMDDQANFKVVKKRSKGKSGNKSESDTDKTLKTHHHHKRRNKIPISQVPMETKFKNYTASPPKAVPQSQKKMLKPTDAYEANFLQFIQSHEKAKEPATMYSNISTKGKPLHHSIEGKAYKVDADGSLTVTASSLVETTTSTNTDKVVLSANSDIRDNAEGGVKCVKKDSKEVQFVCSYCDKSVFREKEYIIRHIKEVHAGEPVLFRELPFVISDNHIEYVNEKDKLINSENIFERMSDLYSSDPSKAEKKVPDKTSAEADSTTEVDIYTQQQAEKKAESADGSMVDNSVCDANDEDSGSLNLKIVEVVSLKDQVRLLDNEDQEHQPLPKTPTAVVSQDQISKSAELKIPQYPRTNTVTTLQQQIAYEKQLFEMTRKPTSQPSGYAEPTLKKSAAPSGKVSSTFKCEKCNVHAPLLAAMVAHLRNAHKEIPRLFQCPYCRDMEAESEAKIHQHIRQFHPTDNPNPPVALSEPAKKNLRTIQVHLPDNIKLTDSNTLEKDIYMCLNCKLHKPSLETIYEHLEEEHSDVFVYVCPFCKTFKSKKEDVVNNHLVHIHQQAYGDVNLSLAIDGNQFTRVSCLIKDKSKSHKNSSNTSHHLKSRQHSPVSVQSAYSVAQMAPLVSTHPAVSSLYQRLLQPTPTNIYNSSQPLLLTHSSSNLLGVPVSRSSTTLLGVSVSQPSTSLTALSVSQSSTNSTSVSIQPKTTAQVQAKPSPPVKPVGAPKRKKNLLESIEQLTIQKQLEQQGLLKPGSKASTQTSSSLHSSSSELSTSVVSTLPPPLIRGPPPLIRFDQLGKAPPSYSVAMANLASRTQISNPVQTSAATVLQQKQSSDGSKSLSVSQPQLPPRQIQSSLFDTSDPDTFKPVKRGPVLNVPVVSRNKFSPGLASKSPSPHAPQSGSGSTPLDLSKTTPSPSPQPQNLQSPPPHSEANPLPIQVTPEGVNPEVFKVFNLKPTLSQPLQMVRPTVPMMPASLSQIGSAQHIMPQQVRPNTNSTLAYRPTIPHVNTAANVPQIINMGAVIGNMFVPITSLPQGFQAVQGVGQVPGLPTQLVQMSLPQPIVSQPLAVNVAVTSQASGTSKAAIRPQQPIQSLGDFKLPMFKCPYCPKVIRLTLAEVQPHIETNHPGSSIVFTQLDNN